MALSLQPEHLRRYKDIARLLFKYGRADLARLVDDSGADSAAASSPSAPSSPSSNTAPDPAELARDLEALGPTFIKLGQLLSTRPDLLPPPYVEALSRLQDQVAPFSFAEVEEIVSSELGVRISKAFSEFSAEPLAAASLGQVHRAALRDGRAVVVKVQRPGIRQVILEDLAAFEELAGLLDRHTEIGRRLGFLAMVEEFRRALLRELDYRREAVNLVTLGDNLRRYRRLWVPRPIDDFTTSRVLTMEYVAGTKITDLPPLARLDLDAAGLAEELCKAYLDQVLVDGFFHADPHPGNLLVTAGGRLALIDLGMVARVEPQMQERLLKLLLALSDGRGEEAAKVALAIGTPLAGADRERFCRQVADLVRDGQGTPAREMEVGRTLLTLAGYAAANSIRPAPELTMLGKTLLHLDEVARALDPAFDPNRVVREQSDTILRRHMLKRFSPGSIFASTLELYDLAQHLPARLNAFLEALAGNKLELKINAFDETRLMSNLQKIANRIATGIVLAALIIGAALMMQVATPFTVFGYPGLAMVLFLLAAACGFLLVLSIWLNDDWRVWRNRRASRGGGGG